MREEEGIEGDKAMFIITARIRVKPEYIDAFMTEILEDAKKSIEKESGCLRFDVLQNCKNPNEIHLYEVYKDEAAFDAHRKTEHFNRWESVTKAWRVEEHATTCANIFPPDSCVWRIVTQAATGN